MGAVLLPFFADEKTVREGGVVVPAGGSQTGPEAPNTRGLSGFRQARAAVRMTAMLLNYPCVGTSMWGLSQQRLGNH